MHTSTRMTLDEAFRYVQDNGLRVVDIETRIDDKESDQYGDPEQWHLGNGEILEIEYES